MFRNYVKVAYRNLVRNKLYSTISVVGLSIGIACCLLVFLYVEHELSFDRFHERADSIYRVILLDTVGELSGGTSSTSALLKPVLKETFPEITRASVISGTEQVVRRGDKSFSESIVHVDPDFFLMFSFPLIQGEAASVLDDPGSVVLTRASARKYFGDDDPVGQMLTIQLGETPRDFFVSGIIEEAPANSSIQYDMLISTQLLKYTIPEDYLQTWDMILFSTFVQVNPDTDIPALEEKISSHIAGLQAGGEDERRPGYLLQRLTDIHLNPSYEGEMIASSDPVYSFILGGIALAVLIIACINFMALTLGRSSTRTREVGLRKVLGAYRGQLMKQFWAEALLLSIAALILGVVLAEVFLPTFNTYTQRELTLHLLSDVTRVPVLAGLAIVTAFLAGIYPAVLLSRLYPAEIMRGAVRLGGKHRLIQGMVILQFAISVFLIIGTYVISSQIDYIRNARLGYDQTQVVTFPTGSVGQESADLLERFRTELSDEPAVVDVAGYAYPFGQSWLYLCVNPNNEVTVLIGEDVAGPSYSSGAAEEAVYFYINWVDPHFISTMGITVSEGRNFSDAYPSDQSDALIINRAAAEMYGLDNPVGGKLPKIFSKATVIGVVDDFHYYPLHREIEPLVLRMPRHDNMSSITEIAVRIRGDNIPATLSLLEKTWSAVSHGKPFTFSFLDKTISNQYAAEQHWRNIVRYASGMSILIACLGLFGLSSLAVARRTKEIGIRKVLGAPVARIVTMLSGDFVKLVLAAVLVAWPAAYLVMNHWVQNFAFRTQIGIAAFLFPGLLALAIAMLTVGIWSVRAALANPVDTIRHE